jgi:transposase
MRVRPYRLYDEAFREDALRLLERGDRNAAQVARDLGIPPVTLRYWYRYNTEMSKKTKKPARSPAKASTVKSDGESPEEKIARLERENEALRKKNAELEMDRAILKKAAAFFAKESE